VTARIGNDEDTYRKMSHPPRRGAHGVHAVTTCLIVTPAHWEANICAHTLIDNYSARRAFTGWIKVMRTVGR
jgi:hypothetical protein